MEKLSIEGTTKTPTIITDPDQGLLEITGRSNPENSVEFYKPIMDWVDAYVQAPVPKTTVTIKLEHFNTSSSKMILDVFKRLEPVLDANKEIIVQWYYEEDDEELLEAGETYESMSELPFVMIPY
jgi:hypothetical protein